MSAVTRELFVEQGATFFLGFNWYQESTVTPNTPGEPYDLTGASARMQIRKKQGELAMVEATTENGKITLGDEGRIEITLSAADTDALIVKSAAYDLEIVMPNGDVHRLLKGPVTIDPNITQVDLP